MKVQIMSRVAAREHKPTENSFIIRVADQLNQHSDLDHSYTEELRLGFYDVIGVVGMPSNWTAFSSEDAKKILELFIRFNETNGSELIIHCEQGISRSSGIAVAYGYLFDDKELIEQIDNSNRIPNIRVISTILRLANYDTWKKYRREIRDKYDR